MEKVCELEQWTPRPGAEKQTDAYWYDDGRVIVVREGRKPEESTEIMYAAAVQESLSLRNYRTLRAHSQKLYDFLKAKGF